MDCSLVLDVTNTCSSVEVKGTYPASQSLQLVDCSKVEKYVSIRPSSKSVIPSLLHSHVIRSSSVPSSKTEQIPLP